MRGFRINIVLRTLIILSLSLLLAWVLTNRNWFFTPLVLSILLVSTIWNLVHYVEKTSRNLSLFLLNIKQGDFTSSFKKSNDPKHELYHIFDDVIEEFQRVTMDKEANYLYLQTLNENIGVGLVSYDEHGKIDLFNPAAKAIFKIPNLLKISQLGNIDQSLLQLVEIGSGERKVIKTVIGGELIELSALAKTFKVKDKAYTLLIIQNINAELEQKEVEAWQKLISVLTHEIMNSVTPISSLSGALNKHLSTIHLSELDKEDEDDIKKSLYTIESRSKGLMTFVNAYKEFTKSPELNYSEFSLMEMAEHGKMLLSEELEKNEIKLMIEIPSTLRCKGDKELLQHVVINLLKNATEALDSTKDPQVRVSAKSINSQIFLQIADNGSGIVKDALEKVFVPFYTTKAKGTGVGLSFARKVMRLHNGQIKVSSKKDEGTTFSLIW